MTLTSRIELYANQPKSTSSGSSTGSNSDNSDVEVDIESDTETCMDFEEANPKEFDGTTVLCRVCGDKASGFHYGVHSCEGCKGFFRRSIQQKIQYRPCTKNQQCSILRVNRNRCQYCRLKKCIAVGMSRDAVRFGRVPKREKAKILAAMQQSNIAKSAEHALARELEDIDKLTTSIVEAHLETCEFTRAKVERMFEGARRDTGGKMACPLNPQSTPMTDFSSRFSPAIRGVVEFAKRLPGFSLLSQDDQVTLLKAGVFEVLLVRLASMFRNNAMLCINGVLLERCSAQGQNTRFLLDSMFKFAEGFNELGLSDEVVGIFCAVVVMASDRPGLRNTELIHRLSMNFRQALNAHLPPNLAAELERKIPDLRTLNTLHSEKLLAFKMEESFQDQPQTTPEYTYKSFPSPSADSGIESGNCSSPARSEDFGSVCEEMPVLKRALQAPPMVDNNFVCEFSKVNHKKFRRQSPPPPTHTPPPAMLYPQLASALTRPPPPPLPTHHHHPHSHQSTSSSSSSSHSSSQSSLFSAHSTLALRLNEKPSNCETSDYIHSLIMAEPSPDYESPLNLSTKHPQHSSSTTIQV